MGFEEKPNYKFMKVCLHKMIDPDYYPGKIYIRKLEFEWNKKFPETLYDPCPVTNFIGQGQKPQQQNKL